MGPTTLSCCSGCNYVHSTFSLAEKVSGCSFAYHCHLETTYGLAPSWGNGWGSLSANRWVIDKQHLGGCPLITSTNLALISSPARFLPFLPALPEVLPLNLPPPASQLTFLSQPAPAPGNSCGLSA